MVFHIVLIWVMVAILNQTLFKPINRILAEREERTKGSLSETGSILSSVSNRMNEYELQLREARTEGYRELEQEKAESVRERDKQLAGLKSEMAEWIAEQKVDLQRQTETAKQSLAAESDQLGRQIASRILGRPTERAS